MKTEHKYLTLTEIEHACLLVAQRYIQNPDIREKNRTMNANIIGRFIYYKISREQQDAHGMVHTMKEAAHRLGQNHATLVNAIKSLESLIRSKHNLAGRMLSEVREECAIFLKNKYEIIQIEPINKSILIGIFPGGC